MFDTILPLALPTLTIYQNTKIEYIRDYTRIKGTFKISAQLEIGKGIKFNLPDLITGRQTLHT